MEIPLEIEEKLQKLETVTIDTVQRVFSEEEIKILQEIFQVDSIQNLVEKIILQKNQSPATKHNRPTIQFDIPHHSSEDDQESIESPINPPTMTTDPAFLKPPTTTPKQKVIILEKQKQQEKSQFQKDLETQANLITKRLQGISQRITTLQKKVIDVSVKLDVIECV